MGNVQGSQALSKARNRRPVARVMRPDGSIHEFGYRIQVKKLIPLYPGYMLVQCSTSNPSTGQLQCCALSAMELDDFLVPGQAYILTPIPSTLTQTYSAPRIHSQADRLSGSFSDSSGSNRGPSSEGKRKPKRIYRRDLLVNRKGQRSMRIKALMCFLIKFVTGQSCDSAANGQRDEPYASAPLLHAHQKDEHDTLQKKWSGREEDDSSNPEKMEQKTRPAVLTWDPYVWTPALDCIPESPLGYHDAPQFEFQHSVPPSPRLQSPRLAPLAEGPGLERSIVTPPISPRAVSADGSQGFEGYPIAQPIHHNSA